MITDKNYTKILEFLDEHYMDNIVGENNWHYYGVILDWYFKDSKLSFDYFDIFDFFDNNGGFNFVDTKLLSEQYGNLQGEERLKIIENILSILNQSSYNKEQSEKNIAAITTVLQRDNLKVVSPKGEYVSIDLDHIIGYGSYCNIIKVSDGVLRKELKTAYINDEKMKKRMKYEYENMSKLSDCPQILNVFQYDEANNTYMMEQADMNLGEYLEKEIDLSFEKRLKVIMDILKGMAYAHNLSIIHRDLHLGNVLKIGGDFVICDFGLSKDLSIVRSMKSSCTPKNNHRFVDPLAFSDFTKLDKKSDIYSIGKMIEHVFTYKSKTTSHIFEPIVDRCTYREKNSRYNSVEHIIKDVNATLKAQSEEQEKSNVVNKILNNQYDILTHQYILDLVLSNKLSKFLVKHNLSSFWSIIVEFESTHQIQILTSIEEGYAEATGYGGWENYDIFSHIAYNLYLESEDVESKRISKRILEGCAEIRYEARDLLDKILD